MDARKEVSRGRFRIQLAASPQPQRNRPLHSAPESRLSIPDLQRGLHLIPAGLLDVAFSFGHLAQASLRLEFACTDRSLAFFECLQSLDVFLEGADLLSRGFQFGEIGSGLALIGGAKGLSLLSEARC